MNRPVSVSRIGQELLKHIPCLKLQACRIHAGVTPQIFFLQHILIDQKIDPLFRNFTIYSSEAKESLALPICFDSSFVLNFFSPGIIRR